ncbi:MAG: hypothetical protein NTW75_08410 [Planctomycetales bacterium]|nr:hypothetical protein [Planctomycetales bacterium]
MNDGRAFLERHVRATLIAVGLRLPRQEPILRGSDSGQRWGLTLANDGAWGLRLRHHEQELVACRLWPHGGPRPEPLSGLRDA